MPIVTTEGPRVSKGILLPPISSPWIGHCSNEPMRCCLVTEGGGPRPVLEHAARQGFRHMNSSHLDKLMSKLGLRFPSGSRPTRIADMVRTLVRRMLPTATDEEVEQCLAQRPQKFTYKTSLQDPANLQHIEHAIDEDDLVAIKESVQREKKAQVAAKATRDPETAIAPTHGVGDAIGKGAGKEWQVRPCPSGPEDMDVATARSYLPTVAGIALTKDVKRFSRWSLYFPKDSPPYYCTKAWGARTGLSVRAALRVVLKQAWEWYHEQTGKPVELSFDDV